MLDSSGQDRLHLCAASPWDKAVAALFGRDGCDLDGLAWHYLDDLTVGDSYLQVVNSPAPTIVQSGVVVSSPYDDGIEFDGDANYPRGVALSAIERRIGVTLWPLPLTIDEPKILAAIYSAIGDELDEPTPWREIDKSPCPSLPSPANGPSDDYGCPCCDRTDIPLELHHTGDATGQELAHVGTIFVCGRCHALLHSPLPPVLADLVFDGRPPCPSCSAIRSNIVINGMPPGPPPPGYVTTGCTPLQPEDDYGCARCGFAWSEEDRYFPRVHAASPGERVRARIALITPNPESEEFDLRQPGRLVVGRMPENSPPPGLTPAWASTGESELLIGDDHRIYDVDPRSIRHLDPDPDRVPGLAPPLTTPHVRAELLARLENPDGDVTLCTSRITSNVATLLASLANLTEVDWYLLTRLSSPGHIDGELSTDGLRELLDAGVSIVDHPGLSTEAYVVGDGFAVIGTVELDPATADASRVDDVELAVQVPHTEVSRVQQVLDTWWFNGIEVDATNLDQLRQATQHVRED